MAEATENALARLEQLHSLWITAACGRDVQLLRLLDALPTPSVWFGKWAVGILQARALSYSTE